MTYMHPVQTLHENFLCRALHVDYYRMFFRYVFFTKVTFTEKTHLNMLMVLSRILTNKLIGGFII